MKNTTERNRRKFWAKQLDEAYEFMLRVMEHPVVESYEKFVSLKKAVSGTVIEVVFSSKQHVLGLPRLFVLRQGLVKNFCKAAEKMNQHGWIMRIEDAFRNKIMQKYLGRLPDVFDKIMQKILWELNGKVPTPEFVFKRIMTLIAQIPKTGTHMSGSALDISVVDRKTNMEIDRGAPYLEMSERTPMESPFISVEAKRNREKIMEIMIEAGFVHYPYEFWHFNSGDAYEMVLREKSVPARYGAVDWEQQSGIIKPIEKPEKPLNKVGEIKAEIQKSLERLKDKIRD